jgi:hypothetical protein
MMANYTIDEQTILGNCFITEKSIEKVHLVLSKSFNESQKWSIEGIRICLKTIFKKSINKLMKDMGKQEAARSLQFFDFDQSIGRSVLERGELKLQVELIRFYLGKKPYKEICEAALNHLN